MTLGVISYFHLQDQIINSTNHPQTQARRNAVVMSRWVRISRICLVFVAVLSESSLEKIQLTDANRVVKRSDSIHQRKNCRYFGKWWRKQEFTWIYRKFRASRCTANVAMKKGNKFVVSRPKRFRRPKKLPSFVPTPPPPLLLSTKQNDEVATNIPQPAEWPMYRPVQYHLLSLAQKKPKITQGSSEHTGISTTMLLEMTAETWEEGSRDVAEKSQYILNEI